MDASQRNGHKSHDDIPETLHFEEIRIPVPWGHIAGKYYGRKQGIQPILALHGWQDNAGSFDGLAPYLVDAGLPLLSIDLPGHGFSSPYPAGMYYYIFLDGVQILKRVIAHFGWTARLQMVGHSLGGMLTYIYASAFPDEVESFACIDIASPTVRDASAVVRALGTTIGRFLKYDGMPKTSQPCYEYDEMLATAVDGYKGSCTRDAVRVLLRRGMQPAGDGKYYFSRDVRLKAMGLGMIGIDESLEMAKHIRCRVLNVRARPGMKLERPEYYDMVLDELERHAAAVERHEVDGMHHVHLNEPERVAPILVGFFKRPE